MDGVVRNKPGSVKDIAEYFGLEPLLYITPHFYGIKPRRAENSLVNSKFVVKGHLGCPTDPAKAGDQLIRPIFEGVICFIIMLEKLIF